eukprot:sb/3474001/
MRVILFTYLRSSYIGFEERGVRLRTPCMRHPTIVWPTHTRYLCRSHADIIWHNMVICACVFTHYLPVLDPATPSTIVTIVNTSYYASAEILGCPRKNVVYRFLGEIHELETSNRFYLVNETIPDSRTCSKFQMLISFVRNWVF